MKEDEGLRKRELEVKERKQQQQVLKRSQRALKGSVSHTITLGLAGKRVPNNEKK
jgi:hypothetical protein